MNDAPPVSQLTGQQMAQKIADWCQKEAARLGLGGPYGLGLTAAQMYAAALAQGREPK